MSADQPIVIDDDDDDDDCIIISSDDSDSDSDIAIVDVDVSAAAATNRIVSVEAASKDSAVAAVAAVAAAVAAVAASNAKTGVSAAAEALPVASSVLEVKKEEEGGSVTRTTPKNWPNKHLYPPNFYVHDSRRRSAAASSLMKNRHIESAVANQWKESEDDCGIDFLRRFLSEHFCPTKKTLEDIMKWMAGAATESLEASYSSYEFMRRCHSIHDLSKLICGKNAARNLMQLLTIISRNATSQTFLPLHLMLCILEEKRDVKLHCPPRDEAKELSCSLLKGAAQTEEGNYVFLFSELLRLFCACSSSHVNGIWGGKTFQEIVVDSASDFYGELDSEDRAMASIEYVTHHPTRALLIDRILSENFSRIDRSSIDDDDEIVRLAAMKVGFPKLFNLHFHRLAVEDKNEAKLIHLLVFLFQSLLLISERDKLPSLGDVRQKMDILRVRQGKRRSTDSSTTSSCNLVRINMMEILALTHCI